MNDVLNFVRNLGAKTILLLFQLLPVKTNKIFIFSYYGSQYGGSPKAISDYIKNQYPVEKFDVVWAFNDMESREKMNPWRQVKVMSWKYFYELATAKVMITNYRTPKWLVKRKGQFYIQTWHSSLRLKQIEKDAVDTLPDHYIRMAKRDSAKIDLLLSGCLYSSQIFHRAFWYKGEIFESGTPANDLFFHHHTNLRKKVMNKLNLPIDSKVVLYAPTFRNEDSMDIYQLKFTEILTTLQTKFGGEWTFLVKLHPHLIHKTSKHQFGKQVIDVTRYDDIQELLYITDVLISDYSAVMFDFILTGRPCFLYVPDLEDYMATNRELYFNVASLPFMIARDHEALIENIVAFKNDEYKQRVASFLQQIGSFENGTACKLLVERIHQVCYEEERGASAS